MKMELTTKDIWLLKIVTTILIAVVMVLWVLVPALEKQSTLSYLQEELEMKQQKMRQSIGQTENTRAALDATKQKLAQVSAPLYRTMEPREIDTLVTGLAYRHGLFPARLDIGERTEGRLSPYLYSRKKLEAEENGKKTAAPASNKREGAAESYLQMSEASITLTGSQQNFLALLDDIEKNYPSVQVKSFDVGRAAYMNTSMNLVEEIQSTLVLNIYMCRGTEESE